MKTGIKALDDLQDKAMSDLAAALTSLPPGDYVVVWLRPDQGQDGLHVSLEAVITPAEYYPDLFRKTQYGPREMFAQGFTKEPVK